MREALAEIGFAAPVTLYGDEELHAEALAFAERFDLPAAHDAHYLALTERLGGTFWTVDDRLGRKVQPGLSWVYVVG